MADKQHVLTTEGLKKLQDELEELKSVKRREIADKIKVALSFGDLSENSEYDEAKNEQGIIEARISEIEATLQNVKVLDSSDLSTEHISVGNRIVLKNLNTNEEMEFHIVGSKEVDMKKRKISDESPVGKACMGKAKGDVFEVEAPAGIMKFEVLDISK
ncbi:MAG: transcription elongation factor GreA [Ruminococcaceae bacterium]|nr:transcription elongation factor GreA [Oscillospiraceae bacterium]MBD5116604.1 transcription elongation factor GreA [Oscillospiraceae bacterium]